MFLLLYKFLYKFLYWFSYFYLNFLPFSLLWNKAYEYAHTLSSPDQASQAE